MMRVLFEKAHINMKMLTMISKAFPSLGDSLKALEDPMELHGSVHGIVALLVKGLEEDHGAGYFAGEDIVFGADFAEARQESTESVPSGSNGHREEHTDGGTSSGVPSSVLGTEVTSEVLVLRYETEVQSGEGA